MAGPEPVQRVLDHLADEGYGDVATTLIEGLQLDVRPDQDLSYRLILQDEQLVMGISVDGGATDNVDYESFDVRGRRMAFIQQGTECEAILRWTVTGDRLRLSLVEDPCPDVEGTPDAAYLIALYSALPFARSP